jgi:prevent-host-death family protein
MLDTISAKQIQREYKKIFQKANKENKPILVITNNKPVAAIISIQLLDKLENMKKSEQAEKEAFEEYQQRKAKLVSSAQDLQKDLKELEKELK